MFESKITQDIKQGINLFSFNTETQRLEFNYTDEIKSQIESVYLKHFPNLNLNASTPQGQQITTLTQSFNACIDYLESCGTSFFLGGEGIFLDYWVWNIFRLRRKQGVPASVVITISGIAGTSIPSDFQVSDNQYNYTINEATEIGENGSVEALFYCNEINDYVAPANTINQIVTIISGVERVENKAIAVQGSQRETDLQLWRRALQFGSTALSGSFRSIMANVAEVSGVLRVGGYENITESPETFKGTEIDAHCFGIVVEGGKDIDIASAILRAKGTGSGMNGSTAVDIWSGKEKYTYRFFRPTYIPLKCDIIVTRLHNPPEDFADIVKQNLMNYANNVDFGYLITQPNLVNACYGGFQNQTFIKDLKFGKKSGGDSSYDDIQLNFTEAPSFDINDIQIQVTED